MKEDNPGLNSREIISSAVHGVSSSSFTYMHQAKNDCHEIVIRKSYT